MKLVHFSLLSTEYTLEHPLETNSNEMLPEPENKSRTIILEKSNLLVNMLNNDSLTLSVVGLVLLGKPFGILIKVLFLSPAMI